MIDDFAGADQPRFRIKIELLIGSNKKRGGIEKNFRPGDVVQLRHIAAVHPLDYKSDINRISGISAQVV